MYTELLSSVFSTRVHMQKLLIRLETFHIFTRILVLNHLPLQGTPAYKPTALW